MSEQNSGRRVATDTPPVKRKGGLVIAVILLLLALGYVALCALGSPDVVGQGVTIDGISVSGLTASEALSQLEAQTTHYPDLTIQVADSDASYTLAGTVAAPDYQSALDQVTGSSDGFLTQGVAFLSRLLSKSELTAPALFTQEGEALTDDLLSQIVAEMGGAVEQASWTVEGDKLVIDLGTPGRAFDFETTKPAILATLAAASTDGTATLVLESANTDPDPVDVEALYAEVHTDATDATLDSETFEVLPDTVGVDFDKTKATDLLAEGSMGTPVTIPLTLTQPAINAKDLEAVLFRDILGETTTYASGSSNRASNVKHGAAACNGIVILPGEVFSFNNTTGSRSSENGYLNAPTYVNGLSVDGVGGGICQVSSTIYYSVLKSNLKITERANHMYAVGYVPDGMDATVYFGSRDFQFENDTKYPIKIVTNYDNRNFNVKIMGTKTDDVVVQMFARQLSYTPYKTVYNIDPNLAAGTTVVDITPYNGRKVEVYRELYEGEIDSENLISSTLESVNNYKSRDKVVRISPDDAATYGLNADGTVLTPTPETSVPVESAPVTSAPVEPTPAPVETTLPQETPAVIPSTAPTPAPSEVPTPTPEVVETPAPVESVAPVETPTPTTTPSGIPEGIPTTTGG